MTKNITVGISDELSKRMEELKDVNWSAVTRDCIEQYIRQRASNSMEAAIAKVKAKRGDDFKRGYEFIIMNIDRHDLKALEELVYPSEKSHEERLFEVFDNKLINTIFGYENEDGNIRNIHYIVSSEYIMGMQEAAKELLERTR